MPKSIKKFFILLTYLWLRFDPILFLAFRHNWHSRSEFLVTLFGEQDVKAFLKHRIVLKKKRSQKPPPVIEPSQISKQVKIFLKTKVTTASGREQRLKIIDQLIFWATDQKINEYNVDSYHTRATIIETFLTSIFNNALKPEIDSILKGLKKIVFSRVTYIGAKGEPSPYVHDVIIHQCARLLTVHFNELIRIRDEKLDNLTKIKLIKEIKEHQKERGSMAFSAQNVRQKDEFQHRFPLEPEHAKLLIEVLKHYRFSAWPESRKTAKLIIKKIEKQLGFKLDEIND